MKFSQRIMFYLAGLFLLGILSCTIYSQLRIVCFAACMLYAAGGVIYMLIWVKKLENMIDKFPDIEALCQTAEHANDSTITRLADGIKQINDKTKERYSARVMDRQSRLNALQSQINPHFLYNTLECIRSEALLCHHESIANMAKSLASFFRYSISRKENIVTIWDEIENIKNYFLIQNYRFENKFIFVLEAEDEERVYRYLIPKMTIQPIVENAIFHGLETKTGECIVRIRIAVTENKVILVISDNGVGMSAKTLEMLRSGSVSSASGNGIALFNVNQRIKLTFGAEYGLQIYSTEGIGTDIEIIIPIVTNVKQLKEEGTKL